MRNRPRATTILLAAAALTLAFGAACSESRPTAPSQVATGQLDSMRPTAPGPNVRAADPEFFEICKDYTSGSGPDVTFDVAIDIGDDGSIDTTFQTILAAGECEDVWVHGGGIFDRVFVTEQAPAGYTTSHVKSTIVGTTVTTDPPSSDTMVSGGVKGDTGVLAVYTNTAEAPPLEGRFTGGGFQMVSNGVEVKVTRGFTVHCHNLLTNNLEVNWNGNSFHMDKNALSSVTCTFVQDPTPPNAPVSRIVASSTGRCNGGPATIDFVLEDRGEPGRNDRAALHISGACTLDVPEDFLTRGNIQAHFDQPHK